MAERQPAGAHTYAREKGVGLELWFTGPGVHEKQEMDTPANRKAILDQCKSWGIKSLKVDFMENDNQQTMQWYHDMAREAAEYQIMLTFHGSTLPRGQRRRFPNIMTMEGVVARSFMCKNTGASSLPPRAQLHPPLHQKRGGPDGLQPAAVPPQNHQPAR